MELVISLLIGVLLVELYAWLPTISEWFVELAIRHLHAEDQERFREEWKANLNDFPNTIVKLVHALSYSLAAVKVNKDWCEAQLTEIEQHLMGLSEKHRRNLEQMKVMKSKAMGTERSLQSLEFVLQRGLADLQGRVANIKSTGAPSEEVAQKAVDAFEEFGHSLKGVHNRSFELIRTMIDRHSARIEHTDRSIEAVFDRYRYAAKKFHGRWLFLRALIVDLEDLENDVEQLRVAIEHEHECDENDEPLRQLTNINTAIHQSNNSWRTRRDTRIP
jgi:hypothetical protein